MKQLFFLLLFLNMVYFFWGQTTTNRNTVMDYETPLYQDAQLEKLELISKEKLFQVGNKQRPIDSKVDKTTTEAVSECYRVGDFTTENDANELLKELSGLGVRLQVTSFVVSKEFWVVYPSNGDWNQSLENLKQLKAKGVIDFWLVPNGVYKGLISLGLFKKEDRAENRVRELTTKQVEAEIINREVFYYSVKVERGSDKVIIQDELDRLELHQQHSIHKISC